MSRAGGAHVPIQYSRIKDKVKLIDMQRDAKKKLTCINAMENGFHYIDTIGVVNILMLKTRFVWTFTD